MRHVTLGVLALASLAACKVGLEVRAFTSDIVAIATGGPPLTTAATLSLEASTDEKCANYGPTMVEAIASGFGSAEFIACRRDNLTTWADFRVSLPITKAGTEVTTPLAIWVGTMGGGHSVELQSNGPEIEKLVNALPDDVTDMLTGPLEPVISVVVQNDLPTAATISMHGAFIDGTPHQLPRETTLDRRGEILIRLSDVGNASLATIGSLLFVLLPQ